MRVFVTGATGFVGSAVVQELLAAGHQVLGLARSDAAAASLAAAGAQAHRGDLEDLDSLRSGVAAADGVIHTAFNHDFANFAANCEIEKVAIEILGAAISGSDRPLIITSGTALVSGTARDRGRELHVYGRRFPSCRDRGRRTRIDGAGRSAHDRAPFTVRPWRRRSRLRPDVRQVAREKAVSTYVGDGTNHWTAVHRLDAAHLYRLALEKGTAGARYHAVDEEGIPFREIAEVIGKRLDVPVVSKSPEDAAELFGWHARFAQLDCPASNKNTRAELGWQPKQPGLLLDLERSTRYFETPAAV